MTSKEKLCALYNQGLDDWEMSKETGLAFWTVVQWRRKNKLPPNKSTRAHRYSWEHQAIRMEKVLTPEECKIVKQFFSYCVMAKQNNPDASIGGLLKAFRDYLAKHEIKAV